MNNVVTIENTEMKIREYNGQRVVTFKDIDRAHQRKSGTAKASFRRNKKYFQNGLRFLYKGIIINHNKNRASLH